MNVASLQNAVVSELRECSQILEEATMYPFSFWPFRKLLLLPSVFFFCLSFISSSDRGWRDREGLAIVVESGTLT